MWISNVFFFGGGGWNPHSDLKLDYDPNTDSDIISMGSSLVFSLCGQTFFSCFFMSAGGGWAPSLTASVVCCFFFCLFLNVVTRASVMFLGDMRSKQV